MSNQYKNLPKTSQQITDEADRASSRAFARQGEAPYDQDKEEPDIITRSPSDDLGVKISSNEEFLMGLMGDKKQKALGSVVADHEIELSPEITEETRPEDSRIAS